VGQYLIVLAILAAVVIFVSAPVRRVLAGGPSPASGRDPDPESPVAELEAAREAKYRELRDAEFDHRTGKLSDEDYEALDRSLRGEAIEILQRIDREQLPSAEP
jgi:Na+-transporting methylmalonyl-CoA/oxaloacetate decarboxylase gamma subunit